MNLMQSKYLWARVRVSLQPFSFSIFPFLQLTAHFLFSLFSATSSAAFRFVNGFLWAYCRMAFVGNLKPRFITFSMVMACKYLFICPDNVGFIYTSEIFFNICIILYDYKYILEK